MERRLKEALNEAANQYNFNDEVNIDPLLEVKKKKHLRKVAMVLAPVMACMLVLVVIDAPRAIAGLLKSQRIEHRYDQYLIHKGYYYIPSG